MRALQKYFIFSFLDRRIEPKEKETNTSVEIAPQVKCLLCVSVSFSDAVIKSLIEEMKSFFLLTVSGVQSIMLGSSRHPTVSTVKKQREMNTKEGSAQFP